MKPNKYTRRMDLYVNLARLGFTMEEADKLRRIEKTLHRWAEAECGDSNGSCSWMVERDEATDKPMFVRQWHDGKISRWPIPDRERGALKRLEAIVDSVSIRNVTTNAAHADYSNTAPDKLADKFGLWFYHQTDPRGTALYVGRKSDLRPNQELESCYSSAGVAVAD